MGRQIPAIGAYEQSYFRSSLQLVNDFYKVILEDLEFAMKNLPITQEVKGHVTRAAAYHL